MVDMETTPFLRANFYFTIYIGFPYRAGSEKCNRLHNGANGKDWSKIIVTKVLF